MVVVALSAGVELRVALGLADGVAVNDGLLGVDEALGVGEIMPIAWLAIASAHIEADSVIVWMDSGSTCRPVSSRIISKI